MQRWLVSISMFVAGLQRRDDDRGASLVEYLLLVSLIALACMAAVGTFGQSISYHSGEIASAIE